MRIGILAAPDVDGRNFHETERLAEEVREAGHDSVFVDYGHLAVGSNHDGSYSLVGGDDDLKKIDMVLPYYDTDVRSGERALTAMMATGIFSTVAPGQVYRARNKLLAQILFGELGVPHPHSIAPPDSLPDNLEPYMDFVESDPNQKLVVKALFGTKADGVWLHTRGAAERHARQLAHQNRSFMFQKRVVQPGNPKRATDKGVLVCGGQVLTSFKRTAAPRNFCANLAKNGTGESHMPSDEEVFLALTATEGLGIPFGRVDFIDSEDGPMALELNVFPGMQIEKITGVNVARAYVKEALTMYTNRT